MVFLQSKVGKAVKKVFKGWKKKRGLEKLRNDNFAQHLRRRRFVSKFICEGIVGGSCEGWLSDEFPVEVFILCFMNLNNILTFTQLPGIVFPLGKCLIGICLLVIYVR